MLKKVFGIAFLTAFISVTGFYGLYSYLYNENRAEEASNNYPNEAQIYDLPESNTEFSSVTFNCASGEQVIITYNESADAATLVLEGDMAYILERKVSASGTKYASENGDVIYTEHQGEASVELNGETRYTNCVPI